MTQPAPKRLTGRSAIITGPASGIGRAIATAFAKEGADIGAVDVDEAGLSSLGAQIERMGRKCVPIKADLASEAEIERAAQTAISELGEVHVLVNNAGIHLSRSLLDTTENDWERIIAVNLRAPVLLTKLLAAHMIDRGIKGRVINITSSTAEAPESNMAAYVTSKGALRTMTRAIAQELAPHQIAVNSVGPGLTRTPMAMRAVRSTDKLSEHGSDVPLGRIGEPEDVAKACLFLASGDGEFVAGAALYVDGGALLV